MNKLSIKDIKSGLDNNLMLKAQLPLIEKASNDDGTVTMVMSSEIEDRDGVIVKLNGGNIDNYAKNPVILWMHQSSKGFFDSDYDPDNVIGYGEPYMEDGKLKVKIHFEPADINPKADKIRKKMEFGSLRAGSIGFIPKSGGYGKKDMNEDEETFYIRSWELAEFSIVTIPANPDALIENDATDDIIKAFEKDLKEQEIKEKSSNEGEVFILKLNL